MFNLEIKTFISSLLSSNMYTIKSEKKLIVIDPFVSVELLDYIEGNLLTVDYIILTHEHYDHISGVNWLKDKFNTKVICNDKCAEAIINPALNFSKYFNILFELMPKGKGTNIPKEIVPYSCFSDITFKDNMTIDWVENKFELISTPGHSKGSICILLNNKYLFSGDSMLRDYPTVTRLKGGSRKEYNGITLRYLNSLDSDTKVYPGHYDEFLICDKFSTM